MEYIISQETVGWFQLIVFCSENNEHYYLPIDLSKFDIFRKQVVECRCHRETFVVERKVFLNVEKKENSI